MTIRAAPKPPKAKTHAWGAKVKSGDYFRDEGAYVALKMSRAPCVLTHAMAAEFNAAALHDDDSLRAAVKFLKPSYNFCPRKANGCVNLQTWLLANNHREFLDANDPTKLKVFTDHDDFHAFWRLVGIWEKERNFRGSHGWDRHGVRFLARLAWWSLNNKRPDCVNWLAPTAAPAASTPVASAPAPAPAVVPLVPQALPLKYTPTQPLRADQLDAACGLNTSLVAYARRQYGAVPGGMPPSAVRRWYERYPSELPARFAGRKFGVNGDSLQVCHIIARAIGGVDWPFNFVIADAQTNRYFSDDTGRAWRDYVGKTAFTMAQTLARWHAKKSSVLFGSFDPIDDYRLAR